MYILYGGGFSRALAVQMVLEEADLDYELRDVDMDGGEHRGAEFLKLNPAGFTPALVTPEGPVLHEAAGIMLYLADHHALEDMAPLPGDPLRGVFLSKFFYFTNDVQPCVKRLGYPHRYSLKEGDEKLVRRHARARLIERLGVLESWLTDNGPWHLGDRFSLADLHLALWAAYGIETTSTIVDMFPAIGRVRAGVLERPKSGPLLQGLLDLMDGRRAAKPLARAD
tara:strand:+ start:16332 stop:17006 length:675 start_codon:yes stop_codon:yes gene_type:complete